jgi:hypothetical protein
MPRGLELALGCAREIVSELNTTCFHRFESMTPAAAFDELIAGHLPEWLACVDHGRALIAALPRVVDGAVPVPVRAPVSDDLTPKTTPHEGQPGTPRDAFCQQTDLDLATLLKSACLVNGHASVRIECERLGLTLRGARTRVLTAVAGGGKWPLLGECEETRRKTQRALRYALTLVAVRHDGVDPTTMFPNYLRGLDEALRARSTLLDLRRRAMVITGDLPPSHAELAERIRQADALIAELLASEVFDTLRTLERYTFGRLRDAIAELRPEPRPDPDRARAVLNVLRGFAQHLIGINRRGILRAHDRQHREEALRYLHVPADLEGALRELHALQGRDEHLDERVDALRRAPKVDQKARVEDIVTRLRALDL